MVYQYQESYLISEFHWLFLPLDSPQKLVSLHVSFFLLLIWFIGFRDGSNVSMALKINVHRGNPLPSLQSYCLSPPSPVSPGLTRTVSLSPSFSSWVLYSHSSGAPFSLPRKVLCRRIDFGNEVNANARQRWYAAGRWDLSTRPSRADACRSICAHGCHVCIQVTCLPLFSFWKRS